MKNYTIKKIIRRNSMNTNRRKEIRIKADSFREQCNIGHYGIIDLFRDCQRYGYKLIRYPLGEAADMGFTLKKDEDIIIFTNSSHRLSREIFTLAHEIGHTLLHMKQSTSFIDDSITISNRNTDEMEQEANYFAVCLLMPEEKVTKFLDLEIENFEENGLSAMNITSIMAEFNVSFAMALNTLENLGKITSLEKIRLEDEKNQKRVGNLLRSVSGNAKLNSPSNILCIPPEYLEYVIYNYNHSAIPQKTLEKALTCYHLDIEDISDKLVTTDETKEENLDDLIGGLAD